MSSLGVKKLFFKLSSTREDARIRGKMCISAVGILFACVHDNSGWNSRRSSCHSLTPLVHPRHVRMQKLASASAPDAIQSTSSAIIRGTTEGMERPCCKLREASTVQSVTDLERISRTVDQ